MENKKGELLLVDVYADDTGLFSEEECNRDNIASIYVPRWIVEDWYNNNIDEYKKETIEELGTSEKEITFDKWFYSVCICDDFIGFYDFCIIKGHVPDLLELEIKDKVYYEDENDNEQIVYEGTYDECRRWCKYHEWKWMWDYDLKLKI